MLPANRTISPRQWRTPSFAATPKGPLDGIPTAAAPIEGSATPTQRSQPPLVQHVAPPTPLMQHRLSEKAVAPHTPFMQHRLSEQALQYTPRMQHRSVDQVTPRSRGSPNMQHRQVPLSPRMQHRQVPQSPALQHRPGEPRPVPQSPFMQHRPVEPPRSLPQSPGVRPRHVDAPHSTPQSPVMMPRTVGEVRSRHNSPRQNSPVICIRNITRLTSEGASVEAASASSGLTRMLSAPAGQFKFGAAPLIARVGGRSVSPVNAEGARRVGRPTSRPVSPVNAELRAPQSQSHTPATQPHTPVVQTPSITPPRSCQPSAVQTPSVTPRVTPPRRVVHSSKAIRNHSAKLDSLRAQDAALRQGEAGASHSGGSSEAVQLMAIQRSLAEVDFSGTRKLSEACEEMAGMDSQETLAASIAQVLTSMQQLPQQLCNVVGHLHKLTDLDEASSSMASSIHPVPPRVGSDSSLALHHQIADWEADNAELREEIGKRTVEAHAKDRELAEIRATVNRLEVYIEAQNAKFHDAVRRQAEQIAELELDRGGRHEEPSLPEPMTNSHSHDEDYAGISDEKATRTSSASSQPRRRRRKRMAIHEREAAWQAALKEEDLTCEIRCDSQLECMTSPLPVVPEGNVVEHEQGESPRVSDENLFVDIYEIPTPADDRRLAPVAEDDIGEPPPHPWYHRESRSKPGCFYYVNVETGDTTWDYPLDCRDSLADASTTSTGGGTMQSLLSGLCEERYDSVPTSESEAGQQEKSGSEDDEYCMPTLRVEKHGSMPPLVEDPYDGMPLPEPWRRRESRSKPGCFFFVNRTTGETTWQVPVEVKEAWARDSWGESSTTSASDCEGEACPHTEQ
mmetsp:Transcript_81081/g.153904  ORF Transcript_81081/g.153904 Transcript_81081/m.153904 type:complete len:849 (+) Transcript_81081:64-2610(+)